MYKILVKTILLTLAVLQIACSGAFYISPKIRITNHSNIEMMLLVNFDYPDTGVDGAKYRIWRIAPNAENWYGDNRQYWINQMKKNGKVTVFFMPRSLREDYGREEAKRRFKPKEKLILTLEDLKSSKWEILYPYELNKTFKAVPHP